jgi:chromosome segregation ATPase
MNQYPDLPVPAEEAAFAALCQAAAQAAAVAAEVTRSGDDVRALRCVVALDRALAEIGGLATAVPGVLLAAFPGAAVEAALKEKLTEVDRMAQAVRNHRAQLDQLTAAEDHLRRRVTDHEMLRQRVTDLRRLERTAEVLPQLAEYHALIEERVAALSAPVQAAESGLARAASDLAPLADDTLNRLAPQLRELTRGVAERVAAVARAEADIAELEQNLADTLLRERELADLREHSLAALAEHARADRAVLDAITGSSDGPGGVDLALARELDGVRAALADVDAALETADLTLGRALAVRFALLRDGVARQ